MMVDSSARVSIVMAASKGLGRGCAQALSGNGFRVVICARNKQGVDDTVESIRASGGEVVGCVADVSKAADIKAMFELADKTYGRLDSLVVNAGGPPIGAFESLTEEAWQQAFELTLMSAVRAINLAIPRMRAGHYGRIIVLGSSSVRTPLPNLALSNVFRPGLVGVVKTLAVELARDGITVNMVSPGRVDTDRVRFLDEQRAKRDGITYAEARSRSEQTIPVGRYGLPSDVGELVAFLASERAGYITGQSILVDGGLVASIP
jgi:3-oxoacyl-[acyl-carrier protein] reductase